MAEKLNLADIIKEALKDASYTQEELEEIRSLMEHLREYNVGRREYQLPSPFARRRIRIGRAEEPDPRTIKLSAARR
ncbi:MAG: hypothetical protein ABSB91_01980 [Sedimentisphaerales bacterium]